MFQEKGVRKGVRKRKPADGGTGVMKTPVAGEERLGSLLAERDGALLVPLIVDRG